MKAGLGSLRQDPATLPRIYTAHLFPSLPQKDPQPFPQMTVPVEDGISANPTRPKCTYQGQVIYGGLAQVCPKVGPKPVLWLSPQFRNTQSEYTHPTPSRIHSSYPREIKTPAQSPPAGRSQRGQVA